MRTVVFTLFILQMAASATYGQEMTTVQKEAWNALAEQIELNMKEDWDGEDKYLHPKGLIWGDDLPTPTELSDSTRKYFRALFASMDEAIAYNLVPVSVLVVDDVAIINAYLHILTKPSDKPEETIFRLHNTWKKEGDKWLLLATYNTTVKSPAQDDD